MKKTIYAVTQYGTVIRFSRTRKGARDFQLSSGLCPTHIERRIVDAPGVVWGVPPTWDPGDWNDEMLAAWGRSK